MPGIYRVMIDQEYTPGGNACDFVKCRTSEPVTVGFGLTNSTVVTHPTCGQSNGAISLALIGGNSYSYSWSGTSSTSSSVSSLAAGTYTVTITSGGCTLTQSFLLHGELTVGETHTNINCNSAHTGSITITGCANCTYSWSDGQTLNPAVGLSAGTYICEAKLANCSTFVEVTLTEPSLLFAYMDPETTATNIVTCPGEADGQATVLVSGGISPYSYSWDPSGGTGATATGLDVGLYTVTITDDNNCSVTTDVEMNTSPEGCLMDNNFCTSFNTNSFNPITGFPSSGSIGLHADMVVNSNFTINGTIDPEIIIDPGISITVNNGFTLTINNGAHLHACSDMWKGIILQNGATLEIRNSTISDAQYAVEAKNNSTIKSVNTNFDKNYVGIYASSPTSGMNLSTINLFLCKFTCTDRLKFGYANQSPAPLTHGFAGIYINDLAMLNITQFIYQNLFEDLNFGIYAVNSNIYGNLNVITDPTFKHIDRFDNYPLADTRYLGSGIYPKEQA